MTAFVTIATSLDGSKFRVAVTAQQWANRPEQIIDEYAYWHSPGAEAAGFDPWRLIDSVDAHTDGSNHFDVWFVNGDMRTVAADHLLYVKPEHYAAIINA